MDWTYHMPEHFLKGIEGDKSPPVPKKEGDKKDDKKDGGDDKSADVPKELEGAK